MSLSCAQVHILPGVGTARLPGIDTWLPKLTTLGDSHVLTLVPRRGHVWDTDCQVSRNTSRDSRSLGNELIHSFSVASESSLLI
jgi:hypothetical protein